jgi:hypothetical protein
MDAQPNGLRNNDMGALFDAARGLKVLKYLWKAFRSGAPSQSGFSPLEVSASASSTASSKGPTGEQPLDDDARDAAISDPSRPNPRFHEARLDPG